MRRASYTASELSELTGVAEKVIVSWHFKGWVNGKRDPYIPGLTRHWRFSLIESRVVRALADGAKPADARASVAELEDRVARRSA